MEQYKCGYCNWILKYDQLAQHSCFASNNTRSLLIDNEKIISITEHETIEDNTSDKDRLDEDLITAVKNRPALYDFRLPLKQRGRKQKDDLWNEVSVHLKGLYSSSEAEKRWNYLKDCYRKAKNVFKKRQAIQHKSGSAGTPKSEAITPSFRFYNLMMFLNDTLEHRQTITSLQIATDNRQATTSRTNIDNQQIATDNQQASTSRTNIDALDDVSNIDDDVQCGPFSPSSGPSPTAVTSRKRKKYTCLDKCEEALIEALKENKEPSPIDAFAIRLAEGLRRVPYKKRLQLEIEFLTRLYEMEETEKI